MKVSQPLPWKQIKDLTEGLSFFLSKAYKRRFKCKTDISHAAQQDNRSLCQRVSYYQFY